MGHRRPGRAEMKCRVSCRPWGTGLQVGGWSERSPTLKLVRVWPLCLCCLSSPTSWWGKAADVGHSDPIASAEHRVTGAMTNVHSCHPYQSKKASAKEAGLRPGRASRFQIGTHAGLKPRGPTPTSQVRHLQAKPLEGWHRVCWFFCLSGFRSASGSS